ncbi:11245_t:CDS:2, partial [Gigaspora rosea]
LFEITHNTLQDYALKAIEWHEKADKKLKSTFYTGNSRTNLWKKRKVQEQLQHKAKRMQTLDKMWNLKTRDKGKAPAQSYREDILAQSYREDILAQSKRQMQRIENLQRLTSVFHYFRLLLNGEKKIQASEQIADNLWKDIRNTEYVSCCIRGWAKNFLEQGKYAKRASLLDDEDIKLAARTWLRSILPKDRSPLALKKELETNIFPKLLGVPITISEKTTRKFMHLWGFHKKTIGQQIYFNGHEQEDVQEYRKKWSIRMMNYQKKMEQYDVTHDEVYFYANDDNSSFWVEDEESIIKKKVKDAIRLGLDREARVIIKPGQRADGYWKSEDIVKQLREKAIPIFNALHPGTNHNAYALDALVYSRMTLHPRVEKKFKFKDDWFIRNYKKTVQPMFFLNKKDSTVKFKGIKKILEERNMRTGQRLDCQRKEDDEK